MANTASTVAAKPRAATKKANLPRTIAVVLLLLLGLPFAFWLDLRALSGGILQEQAFQTGKIIDDMRGFYASDVVARVLAAHQQGKPVHNYTEIDGAIPIPSDAVDRARPPDQRPQRRGAVSLRVGF